MSDDNQSVFNMQQNQHTHANYDTDIVRIMAWMNERSKSKPELPPFVKVYDIDGKVRAISISIMEDIYISTDHGCRLCVSNSYIDITKETAIELTELLTGGLTVGEPKEDE